MSEYKHTPSPFIAEQAPQGHFEVVAPNAPRSKRRVARLGGPDREANAVLFAAAPDMLEALRGLLQQNEEFCERTGLGYTDQMEAAHAAISKALTP